MRKVLRFRVNDEFIALDGNMHAYDCCVREIDDEVIIGDILKKRIVKTEPSRPIVLCVGLIRRERFADLLEHAAQLGVARVIPIAAARSSYATLTPNLIERWSRILQEGAEVAMRGVLPVLEPVATLAEALKREVAVSMSIALALPPEESLQTTSEIQQMIVGRNPKNISLFIGSEGDWTPEEYAALREHGSVFWSLGSRVLRSETAAIAAVSIMSIE